MHNNTNIREWMFRALMFEAEAEAFRNAGIKIGSDYKEVEKALLEETLAPFPLAIRNDALRMSRIYALLFCFENSVRDLIKERLIDKFEENWWSTGVPKKVQEFAEKRQEIAVKESWLEGEKTELLDFTEFGHLSDIIIQNWDNFSDLIPSQHWLKQRMDELEKTRNFIAHHRTLSPTEFQRIELYISDWNRVVGL